MSTETGAFIVLEGADAVGKQTQAERLVARLRDNQKRAKVFSFHRYNTTLGKAIKRHLTRKLIFVEADARLDMSEASFDDGHPMAWKASVSPDSDMIFQAMAVVDKYDGAVEIAKYVEAGDIAVCDRWWQSSYAYGGADGLPKDWLLRAHAMLPQAGLNVLITLSREVAKLRRPVPEDRYEEDDAKQEAVRVLYAELWSHEDAWVGFPLGLNNTGSRWETVDGVGTVEEVHERIYREVVGRFGRDLIENPNYGR